MLGGIYPGQTYPAGIPVFSPALPPVSFDAPVVVQSVTSGTPRLMVTAGQPTLAVTMQRPMARAGTAGQPTARGVIAGTPAVPSVERSH